MHFMSGMSERMHHARGEDQGMLCETITLYQPLTSWPPGSNSNSLNLFFLIFLMGITVSPIIAWGLNEYKNTQNCA